MADYYSSFSTIIPMSYDHAKNIVKALDESNDPISSRYKAVDEGFWIYGDNFNEEDFDLVVSYIGENFPTLCHTFGVALTCSKHRPGEFGGMLVRLSRAGLDFAHPKFD